MMETSMQNGIDSLRQSLNKSKEEERMVMGKCTYCGKQSGDALKSCSRCKLVLGKSHQCRTQLIWHYELLGQPGTVTRPANSRTSRPVTSASVGTSPIPQRRVFFSSKLLPINDTPSTQYSRAGMKTASGAGLALGGKSIASAAFRSSAFSETTAHSSSYSLEPLTASLNPAHDKFDDRQMRIARGPDNGRDMIRRHKAAARSLLPLRILVQNRRKEKEPILVFGSRMQVVSYGSKTGAMARGATPNDNSTTFARDRCVSSSNLR